MSLRDWVIKRQLICRTSKDTQPLRKRLIGKENPGTSRLNQRKVTTRLMGYQLPAGWHSVVVSSEPLTGSPLPLSIDSNYGFGNFPAKICYGFTQSGDGAVSGFFLCLSRQA